MPLLRLCDCASLSGWDSPGTAETIANLWFDRFADSRPSVFEATTSIEEVAVAAALPLTHKSPKRKAYHLLRIHPDDLDGGDFLARSPRWRRCPLARTADVAP